MIFKGNLIGFIPTQDAARSRAFYEQVLGMRFVSDDTFAIVMEADNVMIRLVRVGDFTPVRFTILGWEVASLETLMPRLSAAGVSFEHYGIRGQDEDGIWNAPDGNKVAWFKNPDGNVLSLSEHSAKD